MAKPYSLDLRERAMARLAAGESSSVVAAALNVGHRPFAISGKHRLFVLRQIEKTPHMTLQVLSEALAARGLKVHPATVGRFLARERKSFKKNRSARRADPV